MSNKNEYTNVDQSSDGYNNQASQNLLNSQKVFVSPSRNDFENFKNHRNAEIKRQLSETPLCEDTTCGYWMCRGSFYQRFANKKCYVLFYGLVGAFFGMTSAYFSGTMTTIEKRFKIPSKNTGIISVAYDISQLLITVALSYYTGKGHRPRWMGLGMLTAVAYCLLAALPHFLYGPGTEAIELTKEFMNNNNHNSSFQSKNSTILCTEDGTDCQTSNVNFAPQLIIFAGQFISGIGGSLYFTLGATYLDDNSPRDKTPLLLSISYFMRMIGPAIGFALSSFCLKYYIAPYLHPIITSKDPRWMGAWWLGWIIISVLILIFSFFLSMFPKELPEAKARRIVDQKLKNSQPDIVKRASLKDMKETFCRLIRNPIFMLNNFASVCYLFGYMPHLVFMTKYMEIQFRQTASKASMVTGTSGLVFAALGVLIAGVILTKYKPKARYLAGWNVFVELLTVIGMLSYVFIGCQENDNSTTGVNTLNYNSSLRCSSTCHCEHVPYAPVCGDNGHTYISACHAGCTEEITENGKKIFKECSCVTHSRNFSLQDDLFDYDNNLYINATSLFQDELHRSGRATPGACPINCNKSFLIFVIVMCVLKFFGATGRTTNFLISIRSVSDKDKPTSLGIDGMMLSLFAFIPSPVFFGWMMDQVCLVWGKTCKQTGNCWLYDTKMLRIVFNLVPAACIALCTIIDIFVWYYVKDLKVFDEEIQQAEEKNTKKSITRVK